MTDMTAADRAALRRQRVVTLLATSSVALLVAVIWLTIEVPATEHFFALAATSGLTWAWRVTGIAFLASLFLIAWVATRRFGGTLRLAAWFMATGIAAVIAGIVVGVLGVDRHGGPTPAAVDLTATILMGAGAAVAAVATLPVLAAAGRR